MTNDFVGAHARELPPGALVEIVATQNAIVTAGLHLEALMRIVAERSQHITGASGAVVELPDGDDIVYRAATGAAAPHVGTRLSPHSLSARCLVTGEVLTCADSEIDPRVDRDHCRAVGARAMVAVPLVHGELRIGVLEVMSPRPDAFSAQTVLVLQLMAGLIASALHYAVLWTQREEALAEVRRVSLHNAELALTDALTGLGNRRAGEEALAREVSRARRTDTALSLVMLDVDHFKRVNDAYGHGAGDAVLRAVAGAIAHASRAADAAFRWGGEEFLVLLSDCALAGAVECAERIRARVAALTTAPVRVTISAGAAELEPDDGADRLLLRADARLLAAKHAGRDRVFA